jgi:hypothetical protein
MAEELSGLKLDFQFETDDGEADLDHSAAVVKDTVSALPGVTEAEAHASGATRFIDPVSIAAIVLTVRFAVKNADDIVASLDDLVKHLKDLGRELGVPRVMVWVHRKKVDINDLTPEQLEELAAKLRAAAQS